MSMHRRRTIAITSAAVLLTLALSACGGSPETSPTTSAPPTASAAPTPAESVTPEEPSAAPAVLPTDCTTLGTDAVREETVGDMTLQGDGVGFVRPAPANATLALGCDWIIEESAGVLLLISTATPAEVTAGVDSLAALGYTCSVSDDFGADFCVLPGDGADTEEMVVARDGVWIFLGSVNRNARAFLSDIAQQIWG
ncbi:hypothetical protein ASD65_03475 [Microbacterium sp. Root61]|uniref:hypothetical protein n=1 Tax=Microbacterium sp. Root61 TaxID=1736570 RepID=UPI0006F3D882|nr:hypothetical protein [Microbacterium sp. Root61]KRA23589.1 hypothetical protein ASD65_03475 [Microbacterium sp. Root61]